MILAVGHGLFTLPHSIKSLHFPLSSFTALAIPWWFSLKLLQEMPEGRAEGLPRADRRPSLVEVMRYDGTGGSAMGHVVTEYKLDVFGDWNNMEQIT